jgi:phosphoglycolate phosphatase-like HAD superfamily hydrolase
MAGNYQNDCQEGTTMGIWALDFDGVLCDTAQETGHRAWEILRQFEPALPEMLPAEMLARWTALRPVLEKGWQCAPLMAAAVQGMPHAEAAANWDALLADFLKKHQVTSDELNRRFEARRDWWIANHPQEWLRQNPFYPGVLDTVRELRQRHHVCIVTTKTHRFTTWLLNEANLPFADADIYALDTKRPKEDTLADLLCRPAAESGVHFIEDRLPTLERILARPDLNPVHLYLATWGYNIPAEHAAASRTRIQVVTLEAFAALARQ